MHDIADLERPAAKPGPAPATGAGAPPALKPKAKGRRLTAQILGVDPANKGACLMLDAIRQEVGRRHPGSRFAVDLRTSVEARLAHGLWGAPPTNWKGLDLSGMSGAAPRSVVSRLGLVTEPEIDVIFDASGFAYGDFWGADKFRRRVGRPIGRWRRKGKTVIMMPQAWGPFTEPGFAEALREALGQADLVFARDGESERHLREAGVANVRRAPDFTTLLKPAPGAAEEAGEAFLIPNAKLIESGGKEAGGVYLRFLVAAAETLRAISPRTAILIHEGAGDLRLAEAVQAKVPSLEIVEPADHLDAKRRLAGARAVISSRFHGLVSALSSGVPSFACGWSHKYAALMADYGCEDHMASLGDEASWAPRLAAFAEATRGDALVADLKRAAADQSAQSRAMWDEIFAVIDRGAAGGRR